MDRSDVVTFFLCFCGGFLQAERREAQKAAPYFVLLRAVGDLLMLPKDMLMDKSVRKEVINFFPMLKFSLNLVMLIVKPKTEYLGAHDLVDGAHVISSSNNKNMSDRLWVVVMWSFQFSCNNKFKHNQCEV